MSLCFNHHPTLALIIKQLRGIIAELDVISRLSVIQSFDCIHPSAYCCYNFDNVAVLVLEV